MESDKPPLPDPDAAVQETISVGDIIDRLQAAGRNRRNKYSRAHRLLLMNAGYAMQQLVYRLDQYENKESVM